MGRSGVKMMRWLGVALLALAVGGCGFQMRGSAELSSSLQPLHLAGYQFSPLMRELRRTLGSGGVALAETRAGARAALVIHENEVKRRVLSVNRNGDTQEYELTYLLSFSVVDAQGRERLARQRIVIQRDFLFDERGVLGKEGEQEQLTKEMIRDAARQLLRRLSAAG